MIDFVRPSQDSNQDGQNLRGISDDTVREAMHNLLEYVKHKGTIVVDGPIVQDEDGSNRIESTPDIPGFKAFHERARKFAVDFTIAVYEATQINDGLRMLGPLMSDKESKVAVDDVFALGMALYQQREALAIGGNMADYYKDHGLKSEIGAVVEHIENESPEKAAILEKALEAFTEGYGVKNRFSTASTNTSQSRFT